MKRRVLSLVLLAVAHATGQETAQPPLPAVRLSVSDVAVTAEVADEPLERAAGMMFRKSLAENSGMLFVMPQPDRVAFWMRNTLLPLSAAYISAAGVVLEIHDLEPHDERPVPSSFANIAYVLEMERGWFAKNHVLPGDRVKGLPPLTGN